MLVESASKSRKSWNGRFGNAFQIFEATDENDLEVAMVVLRGGTHIEKDEERSARAGTYLAMRETGGQW